MRAKILICLTAACCLLLAALGPIPTQVAPAAAQANASANAPDLAAMALRPADLAQPGYGLWYSDQMSAETQAQALNEAHGGNAAALAQLVAQLHLDGWQRGQEIFLGLPRSDDPSQVTSAVGTQLVEYADATGAAAGFALLENSTGVKGVATRAPSRTFGDESLITIDRRLASDPRQPQVWADLTFRTGNLVATVAILNFSQTTPQTAALERLAGILGPRVAAVRAGHGAPGLSTRALRLGGTNVTTYDDHYERLANTTFPYVGESADALAARADSYASDHVTDAYYVSQGVGSANASNAIYYTLYVERFAQEQDAQTWLRDTPGAFVANPGQGVTASAVPNAATVGDGSAMVAYRYARPNKTEAAGYTVYLRVGQTGATVQLDGVPSVPQAAVEQLAAAQATCIINGGCPEAMPPPVSPPAATPAASPAPAPEATPAPNATTPSLFVPSTPATPTAVTSPAAVASPAAMPLDANGRWGEPAPMVPAGSKTFQEMPVIASRQDGSLVAVWLESDVASRQGNAALVWTERPRDATAWTKPRRLAPDAYANPDPTRAYPPALVALPDGSLVVAWADASAPAHRLWTSSLAPGAGAWSAPAPLADASTHARLPILAVGPDGTVYAAWQDYTDAGAGEPRFSWRPSGGSWQPSVSIRVLPHRPVEGKATGGYLPRIAVGTDGQVVAVWDDDEQTLTANGAQTYSLLYSVWDGATKTWGAGAPVAPRDPTGLSAFPLALTGTTDGIQLVSTDDQGQVQWATLARGKTAWTAPTALSDVPAKLETLQLLTAPDGTAVLTWSIQQTGREVGLALLRPGATAWTMLPAVFKGWSFGAYDAAVAADGRLLVVIGAEGFEGVQNVLAWVNTYTPGGQGSVPPAAATPHPRPNVTEPAPEAVYRGNNAHTGTQPGPGPTANLAKRQIWSITRAQVTDPALVDGVLYVGTQDQGDNGGTLRAVDAATGQERWTFHPDRAVYAPPSVADGVVYAQDGLCKLYAVDAKTGKLIWQLPTGFAPPTVADGVVYMSSTVCTPSQTYSVIAADAKTGKHLWGFKVAGPFRAAPTVADGVVYAGSGGEGQQAGGVYPGIVYALDAKTGKPLWQATLTGGMPDSHGDVAATAVYGGMVYATTESHILYALDVKTGKVRWQVAGCLGAPAVSHGIVYCGDTLLRALDSLTGTELWTADVGGYYGSPVVAGTAVYTVAQSTLYVYDAATGKELAHLALGPANSSITSPLVVNGAVYVDSYENTGKDIKDTLIAVTGS